MERVELSRDCQAVQIPAGHTVLLEKGTEAYVTQSLGGTYTLQVPAYLPAGADKFRADFRDKDGLYTILRGTPYVIGYNTQKVSAADAPKTWKDLADAKWKGKLVHAHPGYSGVIATHVLALVNAYGWDYFKQLAQNKLMLVQSAVDPSGVVASGEREVAVDGGEYTFYQIKKKGNPIEIVYPKEGVPLVV